MPVRLLFFVCKLIFFSAYKCVCTIKNFIPVVTHFWIGSSDFPTPIIFLDYDALFDSYTHMSFFFWGKIFLNSDIGHCIYFSSIY